MHPTKYAIYGATALTVALAAPDVAAAKMLAFRASLSGRSATSNTGSPATGTARIRVDTDSRKVSVDLHVRGIAIGALWKKLVQSPVGPIHFHEYAARPGQPDDVVLVLPLPYGPNYRVVRGGFRVVMKDYDYAKGATLLGSKASFEQFLAAMQSGHVVLNIHTEAFTDGEISGVVRGRD